MERFGWDEAKSIAYIAHEGQVDKAGVDYILHPLGVAKMVESEDEKLVAILHDVVEDSDITFEDLLHMGCPPHIVDALRLVTHSAEYDDTHEGYYRDINRIAKSGNQLAINVKFADLTHNSDKKRIENPAERDFRRWEKYENSKNILRPFVSEYLLTL